MASKTDFKCRPIAVLGFNYLVQIFAITIANHHKVINAQISCITRDEFYYLDAFKSESLSTWFSLTSDLALLFRFSVGFLHILLISLKI